MAWTKGQLIAAAGVGVTLVLGIATIWQNSGKSTVKGGSTFNAPISPSGGYNVFGDNNTVVQNPEVTNELAKIRKENGPRDISTEESNKFVKIVEKVPKTRVTFNVIGGDGEAMRFTQKLFSMIKPSGYDAPGDPANVMDIGRVSSVTHVPVSDVEIGIRGSSSADATTLSKALQSIGIAAPVVNDFQADGLTITVWKKSP